VTLKKNFCHNWQQVWCGMGSLRAVPKEDIMEFRLREHIYYENITCDLMYMDFAFGFVFSMRRWKCLLMPKT
jgi:hypothetical protein